MKLGKPIALVATGLLIFGTSLFSRDRDNPNWASSGAVAANLSELASAPARTARLDAGAISTPATPPTQPAALEPAPAPAAAAEPSEAKPATVGHGHRKSAAARPHAKRRATATAAREPAPAPARREDPIQFRLAERG
jgi:hypothetical protein